MVQDLEGQGTGTAQYGAIDALKKGSAKKSELPEGEAGRLFRILVGTYVALFSINFVCDFIYLVTMDGRFPRAMNDDGIAYPSEAERQATVSYTQHMTVIGMMGSATRFSVLAFILYYGLFGKADAALHHTFVVLNQKRIAYYEWFVSTWLGGHLASLCALLWIPLAWCGNLLLKCFCCCGPCQRGLADHDWRKLLHGSVYCALFATFFVLLSMPFSYMALELELEYGFANALSITKSMFWAGAVGRVINTLIWSIPSTFLFLAILQFRFGWLFMWVGTTALMTFVQYNMATLAPILMGINNVFPDDTFAVGRGFPLAATDSRATPWISLNRIYFRDGDSKAAFSTNDQSKGVLSLKMNETSGLWTIADKYYHPENPAGPKIYAQVLAPTSSGGADQMLNVLNETPWPDLHHTGHVGVRLGDKLRGKLFSFAKQTNVSISEIYLIDGSHKDARANAFAGGAKDSIIGLYDTLFLGEHARDTAQPDRQALAIQKVESGESAIQFLSTEVQGMDTDVEDDVNAGVWTSAPTQAMSDDEIVAILGHELAHAALGHLQETTWRQAAVTFFTFAAMGWAAHSPLLAAAFVLPAPVVHVGYCIYQYVVGPPLNRAVKFVSDARIRHNEYEADAFVARMSPRYGTALQTGLAKLSVNTNQDPDAPYWYEALHHDHPTVSHRFQHIEEVMAEEEAKRAKRLHG